MITQTILRDLREERKRKIEGKEPLLSSTLSSEELKQILIIDPHFETETLNWMAMLRKERALQEARKNILFSEVLTKWSNAGKDFDERKNRKNGIQSMINNKILFVFFEDGVEMKLCHFMQYNSKSLVDSRISSSKFSECTKKTYNVLCGSLRRFVARCIYGPIPRYKKLKSLKKAIRPLSLSEAAQILDSLEKKALRSDMAMRDLLIIRLLFYGGEGVEIKNILSLERSSVDFVENSVVLKKRRGALSRGKENVIKCSQNYMRLLKSHIGRRRQCLFAGNEDKSLVLDRLTKRLLRISSALGISEMSLKSIQRSYVDILKRASLVN